VAEQEQRLKMNNQDKSEKTIPAKLKMLASFIAKELIEIALVLKVADTNRSRDRFKWLKNQFESRN
jgi:hypothetical protein